MPGERVKDAPSVALRDADNYKGKTQLKGKGKSVTAVEFFAARSGTRIMATACNNQLHVFDVDKSQKANRGVLAPLFAKACSNVVEYAPVEMKVLQHDANVNDLAVSPCEKILASGAEDHTVKLWETTGLGEWPCIATLSHSSPVNSVVFSPTSTPTATDVPPHNSGVDINDLRSPSNDETHSPPRPSSSSSNSSFSDVVFPSPTTNSTDVKIPTAFVTTGESYMWATQPGTMPQLEPAGDRAGYQTPPLTSNKPGAMPQSEPVVLASASMDGLVNVWTIQPTRREAEVFQVVSLFHDLKDHKAVHAVAFSPRGTLLASGAADHKIKIWETATWTCVKTLDAHNALVSTLAFSPSGEQLASGSHDCTVQIWDTSTWNLVQTLSAPTRTSVLAVAYSPHGNRLVATSNSVDVYDTKDWVRRLSFHDAQDALTANFDKEGTHLAVGGAKSLAKVRTYDMTDHLPIENYTLDNLITWVGERKVDVPMHAALMTALMDFKSMVGIQGVKDQVASLVHRHILWPNERRTHRNVRLYGPPGVGKSHASKIIARIFQSCGMVEHAEVVPVKPADFLGDAVGVTPKKTRNFLKNCVGKVILFDEANTFGTGSSNASVYAREAVTEIITFLDDNKGTSVLMIAGYDQASAVDNIDKNFFSLNVGLPSRFPVKFIFQPYSIVELVSILKSIVADVQDQATPWRVDVTDDELVALFKAHNVSELFKSVEHSNARGVENLLTEATTIHANNELPHGTLIYADIDEGFKKLHGLSVPLRPPGPHAARQKPAPDVKSDGANKKSIAATVVNGLTEAASEILAFASSTPAVKEAVGLDPQPDQVETVHLNAAAIIDLKRQVAVLQAASADAEKERQAHSTAREVEFQTQLRTAEDAVKSAQADLSNAKARADQVAQNFHHALDEHARQIKALEAEHVRQIEQIQAEHSQQTKALETKQARQIETVEAEHARHTKTLKAEHNSQIETVEAAQRAAEATATSEIVRHKKEADRGLAAMHAAREHAAAVEGRYSEAKTRERALEAKLAESESNLTRTNDELSRFQLIAGAEKIELEESMAKLEQELQAKAQEVNRVSAEALAKEKEAFVNETQLKQQVVELERATQQIEARFRTSLDAKSNALQKVREQANSRVASLTAHYQNEMDLLTAERKKDADLHKRTSRTLRKEVTDAEQRAKRAEKLARNFEDKLTRQALDRVNRATRRTQLVLKIIGGAALIAAIAALFVVNPVLALLAIVGTAYLTFSGRNYFWRTIVPAVVHFVLKHIIIRLLRWYDDLDPLKFLLGLVVLVSVAYAVVKLALWAVMIVMVGALITMLASTWYLYDLTPDERHQALTNLGADPNRPRQKDIIALVLAP
eukprot:m.41027 g.41027  ORF g.41027 m.41027 type:complete len:1359 (-) comp8161_c0_seq1:247-4323(-)